MMNYHFEAKMLHEHAITYKENISMEQLSYIVKKANKLGKCDREIFRVHAESDDEGTHIYFDVKGLKNERTQD